MKLHRRTKVAFVAVVLLLLVTLAVYNGSLSNSYKLLTEEKEKEEELSRVQSLDELDASNKDGILNGQLIPDKESKEEGSQEASVDTSGSEINTGETKEEEIKEEEIKEEEIKEEETEVAEPTNEEIEEAIEHAIQETLDGHSDAEAIEKEPIHEPKPEEKETVELPGLVNEDMQIPKDEFTVPSLEEEADLKQDPASVGDSQYAANEMKPKTDDKDAIAEILEKYKANLEEELKGVTTLPDGEIDHSIKIDPELSSVTSQELLKGNKYVHNLFSQVLRLIQTNRLAFPVKERLNMINGKTVFNKILFYDSDSEVISERQSKTFLRFPKRFVKDLKIKHKIITDHLPDIDPSFYSGDGYVIVGGGKYSWFAMLVIETLRFLGSSLPVEVIIPTKEEYEVDLCEKIFPEINARCVLLHEVFGEKLNEVSLTGYQYKAFALLASSFENAFLLDADTYPVTNPDTLFESDLYKEMKMITWPDYWRRTTSPDFYEIRGTQVGERIRHLNDFWTDKSHYKIDKEDHPFVLKSKVPLHDRKGTIPDFTTESGEMMINKKLHFKTLLLALYYNFDGQFGYYPLLSQGGAGEGDKETFVAAANYYDLSYYQLYKKPDRAYGFYKKGDFVDTSIIQYNPVKDHEVLLEVLEKIKEDQESEDFKYEYTKYFTDNFQIHNAEPLFYHVHETKLDPFNLVKIDATFDLNGVPLRNMGGDWPRFDFDLELFLWETVNKHICEKGTHFEYFDDQDSSTICSEFMKKHLHFLSKTNYYFLKEYHDSIPFDNLRRIQTSRYTPI